MTPRLALCASVLSTSMQKNVFLNVFDVRIQVGVLGLQDNFSCRVGVRSAISGFTEVS